MVQPLFVQGPLVGGAVQRGDWGAAFGPESH